MRTLRADHDDASGAGPAVGLIVLRTDEVLERELAAWLPPRFERFHARIPNAIEVTADTLRAMERELPAAAALLPTNVAFDVVAYGCTSASTVIGEARVAELVGGVVPGAAVTNPLSAAKARLADLGASRIALLTPYSRELSRAILEHFEGAGFEIVRAASFDESDDSRVARISERSTLEAVVELASGGGVDAVFGSCTNLRALNVLAEAERRAGVPVLTSNSALAWHVERLASGAAPPVRASAA